MLIRIHPEHVSAIIPFIKETWNKCVPGYPIRFSFLEDDYHQSLFSLKQTGYLIMAFSILAVFISCLGLIGLSSYAAERRTKEIGIRKVLGASVFGIVTKNVLEFLILVVIANIIIAPVAGFIMTGWLQNFSYHMKLTVFPFLLAGAVTLVITILSVSWQLIRAAVSNPVDSLRYE
jgi:putative ABC transport system permease protein